MDVTKVFSTFPPKLSEAAKLASLPEDMFENMALQAGISVPPGPTKMLASLAENIEAVTGTLPQIPLPLPQFGAPVTQKQAPAPAPKGESLGTPEVIETKVEQPVRRQGVELIEV